MARMNLDIRTIYFNGIYLNLVMSVYLLIVWIGSRREFRGILHFILAMLCLTLGAAGLWLRDAIHPVLSIVAANILVIIGMVLIYHAFLLFFGEKRTKGIWLFSFLLPGILLLEQIYFGLAVPDFSLRVVFINGSMLLIAVICLRFLYQRRKDLALPGLIFFFSFGIQFLVLGKRFLYGLSGSFSGAFFSPGNSNSIVILLWLFSLAALPIGFSLLISDRLRKREKTGNREKAILLQELYHRTKNNMQMIACFLSLQRNSSKSKETKRELQEAEARIHAVALVHKKLYQAEDLSNLRLDEYIRELVDMIANCQCPDCGKIVFKVDVERIIVDINTATPLGLIVNELVVNCLEHAFPDGAGEVVIRMAQDSPGSLDCFVRDNGTGLPDNFDPDNSTTLGLMTVKNLVESQLGGTVGYSSAGGAVCNFSFPLAKAVPEKA